MGILRLEERNHFWPDVSDALWGPSWQQWSHIGILIMFFGTTVISFGILLQKQAHNLQKKDEDAAHKPYFVYGSWCVANATYLTGHLLCWLGLGMAPQIILSMLNAWTMVATVVLAHFILGEYMSFKKAGYTVCLALSCIYLVTTGPQINKNETLSSLQAHLYNPNFRTCVLLVVFVVIIATVCNRACLGSLNAQRLEAVSFSMCAAACAWVSAIMSKCTASLTLSCWLRGEDFYQRWEYWLVHLIMLIFAAVNIHCINKSLQKDDATFVVPLYEVTSITGQVILGGVFFEEFSMMSGQQLLRFLCCLPVILSAVCGMAFESQKVGVPAEAGARPSTKNDLGA